VSRIVYVLLRYEVADADPRDFHELKQLLGEQAVSVISSLWGEREALAPSRNRVQHPVPSSSMMSETLNAHFLDGGLDPISLAALFEEVGIYRR
jgi:hypothetical protein